MTTHCGLCQCEVEGSWEEHVLSQQHQENLADPGKTSGAEVRHEMEFEMAMKLGGNHGEGN